jgi:hypothetical protein
MKPSEKPDRPLWQWLVGWYCLYAVVQGLWCLVFGLLFYAIWLVIT